MSKISTKNILKKIFKGKRDKKVKKKVSKKKVVKAKKAKKIISKKIKKVVKKVKPKLTKTKKAVKITETTAEPKVNNLRISKTNEVKPEIKKVKKQETEKREYKIKDYVVYPKHGVGKITAIEKAKIGQIEIQFYKIFIEKEKLTLTVPINQQSNLRPISSINQINKCVSILKTKPKIKRTMWSRRAQEYETKINSGNLVSIAEVVRDLYRKDDQGEQSYSERQMYQAALERLAGEFAAVQNVDKSDAATKLEKIIDDSAEEAA